MGPGETWLGSEHGLVWYSRVRAPDLRVGTGSQLETTTHSQWAGVKGVSSATHHGVGQGCVWMQYPFFVCKRNTLQNIISFTLGWEGQLGVSEPRILSP